MGKGKAEAQSMQKKTTEKGGSVVAKAKAYVQKIEAADMKGDYRTVERLSREAENWLMGLSESDQEKVFNALMEETDSYEYSVPDSSAYGYDDYSYNIGSMNNKSGMSIPWDSRADGTYDKSRTTFTDRTGTGADYMPPYITVFAWRRTA